MAVDTVTKPIYMLTTVDNPYNPFTDFNGWYQYDESAGYHSCEFLSRIVQSSPDLSAADQEVAIQNAIQEIVSENVLGIYARITRDGTRDATPLAGSPVSS